MDESKESLQKLYANITVAKKPLSCTECGSTKIAEILYGLVLPDEDTAKKIERGELILGGCVFFPDSPDWQCQNCGQTFKKEVAE